ncbi:conjugal transfer protein [Streptomyces sp. NPDC006285]|uniref:conjugal transfer protein n=1 Tax=Streptomyces sp. NPDC006285 TaxID=3364742 RepID=UPI0036ADED49
MSSGNQTFENKPAAPMAAGAALKTMHRRVRISRLVFWAVLAAGPVALCIAVTAPSPSVKAVSEAKPTAVHTTAAADPAGYAQLFIGAWLRGTADDATTAQALPAQSMAPDVDLPDPAAGVHSTLQSVTAVRSVRRADGTWSVTVAAQYAGQPVRYYAVPMVADRAGVSFTVLAAPSVVAGPARAGAVKSSYDVSVPEGDLASAVEGFLAAYLTSAGEVERYLAPDVQFAAVSPAPYTTVSVQEVLAVEQAATGEQVPADGTKVRVRVRLDARDSGGGRWPLAYELALTARSGRWEVSALGSSTAQNGGAR